MEYYTARCGEGRDVSQEIWAAQTLTKENLEKLVLWCLLKEHRFADVFSIALENHLGFFELKDSEIKKLCSFMLLCM